MSETVVSLVIPTYNERDNIARVIHRASGVLNTAARDFEIIVVDDNSPDGTGTIVQQAMAADAHVRLITRTTDRDLSRAVVEGWRHARGNVLAVMDGDLQHPPEVLADLLRPLERGEAEIAIASRHVQGGGVSRWSLWRRLMSWAAACAATFFLPGMLRHVRDPMSGFFALKREVLEGVQLDPQGYKILLDVLMNGRFGTVVEVPYVFAERFQGGSKLGKKQVLQFFASLFRLSAKSGHVTRLAKYVATGTVGAAVTLSSLLVLRSLTNLPLTSAYTLAVEIAILNNFVLNEFWTFADATAKSATRRARVIRFIRFNGTCVLGAVFNVGTFLGLHALLRFPIAVAGLAGVTAGLLWNYGVNANATWLDLFPPRVPSSTGKAASQSRAIESQDRESITPSEYYYRAYDEGNRIQRFWHRGKFERVLSRARAYPVLDVGAGPGVLSSLLIDGRGLVVSLDRSFETIRFAKHTHPEIRGVVADARLLPFHPGQFRTIFCVEVIEHIPAHSSVKLLRELRDMLHPEGRLILTTPNYRSLWPILEWLVSRWGPIDYTKEHVNRYTAARLGQEVREAGLKVTGCGSFFVVAPFLACLSERAAAKVFDVETRWCGGWGSILLLEARRS